MEIVVTCISNFAVAGVSRIAATKTTADETCRTNSDSYEKDEKLKEPQDVKATKSLSKPWICDQTNFNAKFRRQTDCYEIGSDSVFWPFFAMAQGCDSMSALI
jgi:hypothetical protein